MNLQRLKKLREEQRYSQHKLAAALNMSSLQYHRIENGLSGTTVSTVEKLADLRLTLCESHIKTLKALMGKPVIREDVAVPKIAQLRKEILSLKEAAKRL